MSTVFAGCAASSFRTARENANQVKNGMTVQQAEAILGMPATDKGVDKVRWRRGNAQRYDATPNGSVEYSVENGIIVGIPEGGVFGTLARQAYVRQMEEKNAALRAANEADKAAEAAKDKEEMIALVKARDMANVSCRDKSTCTKMFSLAQIYVTQNADQKIQVATDTVIQTYNSTDNGNIAASIIKMPGSGSTEMITLTLSCKSENGEYAKLCRTKETYAYSGFRPFIEKNLTR